MIEVRPFAGLGGADHGWLNAKHHFSFGARDGAAIDQTETLRVTAVEDSEVILVDVA